MSDVEAKRDDGDPSRGGDVINKGNRVHKQNTVLRERHDEASNAPALGVASRNLLPSSGAPRHVAAAPNTAGAREYHKVSYSPDTAGTQANASNASNNGPTVSA